MEELFQLFKGTVITYPSYSGVVCGYDDSNFILAIEVKSMNVLDAQKKGLFRVFKNKPFILEEYKSPRYKYMLEDERTIEKQLKKQLDNGNSTKESQNPL